ncbi:MAG: J domain-containing protein [Acidimicrobiales bacterium]
MSHYDVLGVAPAADERAVRQAYVALARRHHPDLAGGDAGRMRAVNEAWATLSDPVRRARYDRALASAAAPRPAAPAESDDFADDFDDSDDRSGLLDLDDRPVRVTVRLPRWLALLPMTLVALTIAAVILGVVLASSELFGLAMVGLMLSCLFFLASPFIALFASRRGAGGERSEG